MFLNYQKLGVATKNVLAIAVFSDPRGAYGQLAMLNSLKNTNEKQYKRKIQTKNNKIIDSFLIC
jgi:hypothetical protein